jgi:hypothetical protein
MNEFVAIQETNYLIASQMPEILYIKLLDYEEVLVHGLGKGIVPLSPHKKEYLMIQLAN